MTAAWRYAIEAPDQFICAPDGKTVLRRSQIQGAQLAESSGYSDVWEVHLLTTAGPVVWEDNIRGQANAKHALEQVMNEVSI